MPMQLRSSQTGLTLVELLVSMLIMGFVLTLVSQAVFQVSQVTRSAQNATAALAGRWAGGWAVSSALANLVAPPEVPLGKAFEGTPDRLSAYTTMPVDGGQTGVKGFLLELVSTRDDAKDTAMQASYPSLNATSNLPATVANFPGKVEFAYLDSSGQLQSQWPPLALSATRQPDDLPRAVVVRRPFGGDVVMWYAFQGETRRADPPSTPFK